MVRDAHFWVPLIAAYTGARREEIAALAIADIGEENGIPYFNFVENENRSLKTAAARRRVPLHAQLIALGFLDHVSLARPKKQVDLFPQLKPRGHVKGGGKKFGAQLQYSWEQTVGCTLDGNPRQYCFHSLRHYANNMLLKNAAIPDAVRLDLIGHEADDMNTRIYRDPTPLDVLRDAINSSLPVIYWHGSNAGAKELHR